jgi:hypothetical protein
MKLAAIALASAFALSSTYALAATQHHKSGVKTHHSSHARNYAPNYAYAGNPNNRGGLVGGDDPGTSARYARVPSQTGWNNNGWNNGWNNNWNNSYGWNNNYGGGGNNRGGLVGGDDPGTRR